jgi:hypothetical protein
MPERIDRRKLHAASKNTARKDAFPCTIFCDLGGEKAWDLSDPCVFTACERFERYHWRQIKNGASENEEARPPRSRHRPRLFSTALT